MTSVPSPLSTSADGYEYTFNYDYEDPEVYTHNQQPPCIHQAWCITLVVVNVLIFLLGIVGNGVVVWVIAFKMKKRTVTTTWYLSLALSDFIFCATLPFGITLTATGSWIFGLFMCKFASFVLFLNMFSSIFLMVLISVDRCVAVAHSVWAQNNRTLKGAAVAVVVAWLFSALLSVPSLVVRDVTLDNEQVVRCYNNFESLPGNSHRIIPVVRFGLGFVLPLAIITVCYTVIIVRLQKAKMARSTKPVKVMTALIVMFVISWLPYHIFVLLDINPSNHTFIAAGIQISVTLASANSCMNPFLYAFMGKDIKQTLLNSFVSKIENALSEEMPSESKITSANSASQAF